VVEEFFDIEKDPDCLNNLMDSSKHQQALTKLQQDLEQWMVDTRDPMLDVFRHRDDPAARAAFIEAQQAEANARSGKNRPRVKS
jgi:N-sulfoglucosamine sulfohydrolase